MPFTHHRTVRLADTDAAGVVFFARTLMLCHEAYEEALARAGLDLKQFLGGADLIVPDYSQAGELLQLLGVA